MSSQDLTSRVDELRRSRRSLSRLTASSMDLQDAGIHDDGVFAIPFLIAWRWIQRRRIERRLPPLRSGDHVIAAYAMDRESNLRPWPGRVSRFEDRIKFQEPLVEGELDLTNSTFEIRCDGLAWIEVRRDAEPHLVLAIYAPPGQIEAVLGIRCPESPRDEI